MDFSTDWLAILPYLLTYWCLQTSTAQEWLGLQTWFLHWSTLLYPEMCLFINFSSDSACITVLPLKGSWKFGISCHKNHPKNNLAFAFWHLGNIFLGMGKPKRVFRSTKNPSTKLIWMWKKSYFSEFSTDWWAAGWPASQPAKKKRNKDGSLHLQIL